MPVGFNSPARNFFLLGSSGDGVVGNFFDTIDRSAETDGVYLPDEIRYNYTDQKYLLAGSASDSNSKSFGWFEKRDETGALDFDVRVEAAPGVSTTLRAMELDSNNNLIVAGFSGTAPWIAKYSNGGVIDWQSTTNSANVRYLGLTSDSNGNYYACGRTSYLLPDTQAFVEKFDSNGNPGWGKSAFMLGRDVVLKSIAANSRGEVVAVGFLEDDSADKGYIVKIDTNTGEVLWDRTLSPDAGGDQLKCTDVYIDNQDQIYVSVNGTDDGYLVKYTAEGNIQWQRKTAQSSGSITYDQVFSDGETQQTVVFGTYTDSGDTSGLLTKYSRNGDLVWRRTLTSSFNNSDTFASVCLDGDPSFYYFMYIDGIIDGLNGTPDSYTFGKVSSSGNGLGAFQYTEGTGETIDYVILNEPDKIGRLSDGSVRHDTSDLVAYPFGATKIMFDDLAAKVTNKKRQMDDADSFEYSGSPAIRPADFQEVNLLNERLNLGPELITNGDFSNGTTGWSNDATPTLTVSGGGVASVGRNGYGPATGQCYQTIATEVGKIYTVSVLVNSISNGFQVYAWQDAEGSGDNLMTQGATNSTGEQYWTFTAVSTSTRLDFSAVQSTSGTASFDNVSARAATCVDQSGKGNDAGAVGYPSIVKGHVELDGTDDYITLGTQDFITTQHSVEMWVNMSIAKEHYLFSFGYFDNTSALFYLDTNAQELVATWRIGGVNQSPVQSGVYFSTDEWRHVVWTRDGATNKLYVDGVEKVSSTTQTTASLPACIYDIGWATTRDKSTAFTQGKIGQVRIYSRELTGAQVFQNYNSTKSKYITEAPDTAPKIGPGIVNDANLLLNYDFGNRATYDPLENLFKNSNLTQGSATDIPSNWQGWNPATWLSMPHLNGPFGDKSTNVVAHGALNQNGGGTRQDVTGLVAGATYTMSAYVRKISEEELAYWNANNSLGLTTGTASGAQDVPWFAATKCRWDTQNTSGTGDNTASQITLTDQWQRIERDFEASSDGNKRLILSNNVQDTGTGNEDGGGVFLHSAFQLERKYNTLYGGDNKAGLWFATPRDYITPSPTTVKNLSSSSYTGTIYAGIYNTDGYFTDDGTNFYIGSNINTSLSGGTMEAWIWFDNVNQNQGMFQIGPGGAGPYINFYSPGASSQKMRWEVIGSTSNSYTTILSNNNLVAGQWYHFVGIFDGASTTALYVNGNLDVQQTNMSNHPTSVNSQVAIGNYAGALDGRIGEVRFYNRDLSATEISQNFNATRGKYGV